MVVFVWDIIVLFSLSILRAEYLIQQRYERSEGFINCKILRQPLINFGYPLVTTPGGGV